MWALWVSNGLIEGENIPPQRFASLAAPPKGQSRRPRHSLVSPLTSLQLGLRFLAVLYFGEGQTFSARQKEASLGIPRSPLRGILWKKLSQFQRLFLLTIIFIYAKLAGNL